MRFYQVFFLCVLIVSCNTAGVSAQERDWLRHPIDLTFAGVHAICLTDLNQDGKADIIGGSEQTPYGSSKGVAWWKQVDLASNQWRRYSVDPALNSVMSVQAADIDGDGFTDILASAWNSNQVAWYKNSGNPEQGWVKNVLLNNFVNAHDAVAADVNQDGRMDVVSVAATPGTIKILYQNSSSPVSWRQQEVINNYSGAKKAVVEDFDHDGDPDIISSADDANRLAWWENQGGDPILWELHDISTDFNGCYDIKIIDFNKDGLTDILASSWKSGQVALFTQTSAMSWEKTVVIYNIPTVIAAIPFDPDEDGDYDIVAVGKDPGCLGIWNNTDNIFREYALEKSFYGGSPLITTDLDQDGDHDIIAGASALGKLYWYERMPGSGIAPGVSDEPDLKVWKNESGDLIFVLGRKNPSENCVIELISMNGAIVKSLSGFPPGKEMKIKVNDCPRGIYLVTFQSGSLFLTRKVLL